MHHIVTHSSHKGITHAQLYTQNNRLSLIFIKQLLPLNYK